MNRFIDCAVQFCARLTSIRFECVNLFGAEYYLIETDFSRIEDDRETQHKRCVLCDIVKEIERSNKLKVIQLLLLQCYLTFVFIGFNGYLSVSSHRACHYKYVDASNEKAEEKSYAIYNNTMIHLDLLKDCVRFFSHGQCIGLMIVPDKCVPLYPLTHTNMPTVCACDS